MLQQFIKISDDPTVRRVAKIVAVSVGGVIAVATAYKAYRIGSSYYRSLTPSKQDIPCSGDVSSDPIQLKEEGNKLYKLKRYDEANKMYTMAIEKCLPSDKKNLAIFYQNRAATYDALKKWDEVIKDCDAAIENDSKYQKAYARRASAHLMLSHFKPALYDAAFAFYLQDKRNRPATEFFEETLASYAKELAQNQMQNRQPVPIAEENVRAYYSNFSNDPIARDLQTFIQPTDSGDRSPFQLACLHFHKKDYDQVMPLLDQELENESTQFLKESLLFRATLNTLSGNPDRASQDLDRLLAMENVPLRMLSTALLRRGLIYIAKMETQLGLASMAQAAEVDPTNADVYHHKGQIALLMQEFDQCKIDTLKAIELQENENPNFLLQKYMCDLQVAQNQSDGQQYELVLKQMEKLCEKYPQEPEGWCLYAQALIFFNDLDRANQIYAQAVQKCSSNARIYIQWASLLLGWRKDQNRALELLEKAKVVDPYCEAIYENMALIYLNQGKLEKTLEAFELHVKYARTTVDCQNALAMVESVKIQQCFKQNFGVDVTNIFNILSSSG